MQDSSDHICYHCGLPVEDKPIRRNELSFCCQGCAGAYELIAGSGMLDYYEFRTEYAPRPEDRTSDEIWELIEKQSLLPSSSPPASHQDETGEDTSDRTASGQGLTRKGESAKDEIGKIEISKIESGKDVSGHHATRKESRSCAKADFLIEGIHCSSCIWLNETMLRSLPGVLEASGNLATNRLRLSWNPEVVSLKELAHKIEGLGYRLLPLKKSEASESQRTHARRLLKRMAVAGFFAGNIMLVSVSLYAGYFGTMDRFTKNFFHLVSFLFATPVMFYSASVFFRTAWASLKHGVLSMDLLTSAGLTVAYVYSIYAAFFEAGEVYFDSVCFVTFAVLAGRYLESRLKLRSLYLVDNLHQGESPFARILKEDGSQEIVASDSLQPGDRILLKPGESLPCDAVLVSHSSEVEQSLLTGEFEPVLKRQGDLIFSGIRAIGEMELRIERSGDHSALRQIQQMASDSLNDSPRSQKFAEMAGRYFVGFVLLASFAAFFYHYSISDLSTAIIITVTLLIVACPCALNLAIPTAFIAGIQRSYAAGILLRNGQHLETIARARHIVFDKTGTLTEGKMEIEKEWFPSGEISEEQKNTLRWLARAMESRSGIKHPVVRAFEMAFGHLSARSEIAGRALSYTPGRGLSLDLAEGLEDRGHWLKSVLPSWTGTDSSSVNQKDSRDMNASHGGDSSLVQPRSSSTPDSAAGENPSNVHHSAGDSPGPTSAAEQPSLDNSTIYLGSFQWMEELSAMATKGSDLDSAEVRSIRQSCESSKRSAVVLAYLNENRLQILCIFQLQDALRPNAKEIVQELSRDFKLTILSGDSAEHVESLAKDLNIQDFQSRQSPEQKKAYVENLVKGKDLILMVGDGINDSAALAASDSGISFAGGAGLALISSDILLLNNDLQDLLRMIRIARSTRAKILQNLILAFAYNVALLPVAFIGWINPFLGAVFMSLSSITVIVNSLFAGRSGK